VLYFSMTIIHGFTSFNTTAPASRIAPSINGDTGADKGVRAAAADWSRWPAGTVFRLLSTGQSYRVEDYGWALSGRNTIDLYMANQREMNSWGAREETIEVPVPRRRTWQLKRLTWTQIELPNYCLLKLT
jgi:3D (Asp-Asp-Asp) domain-containing protein